MQKIIRMSKETLNQFLQTTLDLTQVQSVKMDSVFFIVKDNEVQYFKLEVSSEDGEKDGCCGGSCNNCTGQCQNSEANEEVSENEEETTENSE